MSGRCTTFVTATVRTAIAIQVYLIFASTSFAAESNMTINCQIRATPQNDMLRLEAVATARHTATGTYRFEVSKQSPTGTSQNAQSGAFHLNADHDEILTTVVLDGSALGHYRARLTLRSQEFGSVSCVSP